MLRRENLKGNLVNYLSVSKFFFFLVHQFLNSVKEMLILSSLSDVGLSFNLPPIDVDVSLNYY